MEVRGLHAEKKSTVEWLLLLTTSKWQPLEAAFKPVRPGSKVRTDTLPPRKDHKSQTFELKFSCACSVQSRQSGGNTAVTTVLLLRIGQSSTLYLLRFKRALCCLERKVGYASGVTCWHWRVNWPPWNFIWLRPHKDILAGFGFNSFETTWLLVSHPSSTTLNWSRPLTCFPGPTWGQSTSFGIGILPLKNSNGRVEPVKRG